MPSEGKRNQIALPILTDIGGPLEIVLEADYETDGLPTPRSCLESPVVSSTPSNLTNEEVVDSNDLSSHTFSEMDEKRHCWQKSSSFAVPSPDTPPTLDKLSISASTNSFLQNIQNTEEIVEEEPFLSHDGRNNSCSNKEISFTNDSSKKFSSQQREQRQQHLHEFLDDDDMITLDTHSTITKNRNLTSPTFGEDMSNEYQLSVEKPSQFFAKMEGILERVEETILDESPYLRMRFKTGFNSKYSNKHRLDLALVAQEKDDFLLNSTSSRSTSSREKISTHSHRDSSRIFCEGKSKIIGDNSMLNTSKDSANILASHVTGEDVSKDGKIFLVSNENTAGIQNLLDTFHQHPTRILVNTPKSSPANTNLTTDAAFGNETHEKSFEEGEEKNNDAKKSYVRKISGYGADDNDNLSTITPVLDRYRLDPTDDNSVGVKVVPNKRSVHHNNNKQIMTPTRGQLPTIAQLSPSLEYILRRSSHEKNLTESGYISPPYMSSKDHMGAPTADDSYTVERKVFRKTPYPKRKLLAMEEVGTGDSITSENDNPNNLTLPSLPDSLQPLQKNEKYFSISVPPLRPCSLEPAHVDESILYGVANNIPSLPKDTRSITSRESSGTSISSGRTTQIYHKDETDTIQKIDRTIDRIDQQLASPIRSGIGNSGGEQKIRKRSSGLFVSEITKMEFESAPRIVRANVSRDRVNQALHAIKKYCCESMTQYHNFEFTDKEGFDMVGLSEQENKSILVSLCHWRRLTMKKDSIRGMIFVVNSD